MGVLSCANDCSNPHISALSEDMMRELGGRHDVMVNELVKPDIPNREDDYWVHLAVSRDMAPRVEETLTGSRLGPRFGRLPENSYSWQQGRVGYCITNCRAEEVVLVLRNSGAEIVQYAGPSGHQNP